MSNNLIIINAHIVTPQGRTARKGEAMNELLNIPCGTVRVTDGIITYVGENRISHEKPGYKVLDARGMYCCRDSLTLIPIWFSEDFAPTNSSGGSTATVI